MEFDAWSVFVDVGAICLLLLVGKLLRASIPLVQRLLLPASILAGGLGLALGPHGLGLIPFSDQLETYATILTAAVFGSLALSAPMNWGRLRRARVMWSYSVSTYVLQWGLGALFTVGVLGLFVQLPDGFGLLLAAGWAGGFGTASAVGTTLADNGWEQATSLAFTSATTGVLVAIVGGLILAKWSVRKGRVAAYAGAAGLPAELRTGLVSNPNDRHPIGYATVSPNSLEPLALQLALIVAVTFAGYLVTEAVARVFPDVSVPVFAAAFLLGMLFRLVIDRTPARAYLDSTTIRSLSGTATDLLVTVGIAAIVPSVVVAYAVPLALLFGFGLLFCVLVFTLLTPRLFLDRWVERGLFTWGWLTASVSTGLALLRIVDPKLRTGTAEEFGLAYVGFAPVEIGTAIVAPLLVIAGFTGGFIALALVLGIGLLILTFALRWPAKTGEPGERRTDVAPEG
ncbi:ESS family glutamate:Na+ symporter [Tamaricihabitans halophyticus]|uniref:ESS family glutamate:Na+ symporter n=1 Tax=Tamaricihabitans halophyticus TaxID=1262583 RepID=A0A4R2QUL1_9PSEU|nr:sodium:glutamate symporter [Tamaricihabitans halophyticus]TCP50781.1 ESS family glutamate:Na+ symporter [Tamaricihabitans halophyticus]